MHRGLFGKCLVGSGLVLTVGIAFAIAAELPPPRPEPVFGPKLAIEHGAEARSGPSLRLDQQGALHVAWIEEEKDLKGVYYLRVENEAKALPAPVRVTGAGEAAASSHEAPAVALGPEGEIYLTWSATHPLADDKNPFASVLRLSRSEDGGHTFLPSVAVNDDAAVTNHAFDSLGVDPGGIVHVAWLDARDGRKEPAIFAARSSDGGRTMGKNVKVDEGACVCCRTALATASDGTIYLAWRKVFEGNIRETVVARSTDGGQTYSAPVIVGNDRWVFPGCPHRQAALGVDKQERLYVAWYTEGADETPAIYLATSDDHGRTFSPKRVLNASKGTFPDHPQMAVDGEGRVVVVWEEQSPVRREVVMSYSLDRGQTFSPPQKLNEKKGQSPVVATNKQGLVALAWVEATARERKTLLQTFRLPDGRAVADATPREKTR